MQQIDAQLSYSEWQRTAAIHRSRAEEWTVPYRKRRASGKMHPIYDFLFIYYRNAPAQLEAWHPGIGVTLELDGQPHEFNEKFYSQQDGCITLDPAKMNAATRHRLDMALKLSQTIQNRPGQFGCFGMHEWAMVYRGDDDGEIRHGEKLPLRLSQTEVNAFVESRPINCSHFDAFRFFTPSAKAFNRIQPDKDSRFENEQCGCLHTNMDLYKWAAQSMPWVGSELLWKSFEFAIRARELDMQASAYDCSSLGYDPIPVETPAGRTTYERRQRELSEAARSIRAELIMRIEQLLTYAVAGSLPRSSDS